MMMKASAKKIMIMTTRVRRIWVPLLSSTYIFSRRWRCPHATQMQGGDRLLAYGATSAKDIGVFVFEPQWGSSRLACTWDPCLLKQVIDKCLSSFIMLSEHCGWVLMITCENPVRIFGLLQVVTLVAFDLLCPVALWPIALPRA